MEEHELAILARIRHEDWTIAAGAPHDENPYTGTPSGVGFTRKPPVYLQNGDEVEVELGGVGKLCNAVVGGGGG